MEKNPNMSTGKKSYIIVAILVKYEHYVYKSKKFTLNCPARHIAYGDNHPEVAGSIPT